MKDNIIEVDFGRAKKRAKVVLNPGDQEKLDLFSQWIKEGTVCILFDARRNGVKVPQEFSSNSELRLNFCYEFYLPDFAFDHAGVRGTLSFDSGNFFCSVPWHTVYGMHSLALDQQAAWFENFPDDCDQSNVISPDFSQT